MNDTVRAGGELALIFLQGVFLKYSIEKSGKVTISPAKGNLCGLSKGKLTLSYTFTVTSYELDDRQFVICHFTAADAIEEWAKAGKYAGSCEQVAGTLAEIVWGKARQPVDVTMKLTGNSGASITVALTNSELIDWNNYPRFVRKGEKDAGTPKPVSSKGVC